MPTKKEWIKLIIDIVIVGFSIYCLYSLAYAFNEGYLAGKMECYRSLLNYSDFLVNYTNYSTIG